jgi:adenylate cyclase
MKTSSLVVAALSLTALIVYLFASAPPPLPEQAAANASIPVERVFALVEAENDVARTLWTRDIVEAGTQAGLSFSETWREAGEEAGPLPALFLRETAKNLERNPVRLSLFLGSDAPISSSNRFEGMQAEAFGRIRSSGQPQFFQMPDTRLYTAMFPDEAVTEACVTCHNEHEDSPKKDWKLHDVMGATTWAYPEDRVTAEQMLGVLVALRGSIRGAYQAYLDKAATFSKAPEIGARWPRDGYYLPSADVFMRALGESTATSSLDALLSATASLPPAAPAGRLSP